MRRKKNFFSFSQEQKEIEYSFKCLIDEGIIKIMAFSKYSVIIEKLETVIEALETHMRTKDIYDIF